jgi:hypothetical protein
VSTISRSHCGNDQARLDKASFVRVGTLLGREIQENPRAAKSNTNSRAKGSPSRARVLGDGKESKRLPPYRDDAFDNSGWAQPFTLDDVESLFLHLL